MMPMQPMQPMVPPPKRPPQLPGILKAILVLKAIACVLVLGLTFAAMAAMNATIGAHASSLDDGSRQAVHAVGQILALIAGVQLVVLIGIAGTWSFKRWGVYVLMGFSMLDIVLNLKANNQAGLVVGALSSLIAAFAIFPRWRDYE